MVSMFLHIDFWHRVESNCLFRFHLPLEYTSCNMTWKVKIDIQGTLYWNAEAEGKDGEKMTVLKTTMKLMPMTILMMTIVKI